jgi:hypothetical protein
MKNYVGISRDHSASMGGLTSAAMKDFNSKVEAIRAGSLANYQDTSMSVVECGHGRSARVERVVVNSNVMAMRPMTQYVAHGMGTPLWDSVGDLIEQFEAMPDAKSIETSFLVMAITDGGENASKKYNQVRLAAKIRELIQTDRWTFVFRVPRGHTRYITALGIPEGNIQEWDQTNHGVEVAAAMDTQAFTQYFAGRSAGETATTKFYANLGQVSVKQVKQSLNDISTQITVLNTPDMAVEIRPFVIARVGSYLSGAAFYQLTKTETIQPNKKIIIRDKKSNKFYTGHDARNLLGLPDYSCKLVPGDHGGFDIFIQSTSVNRKLMPNTELVYWTAF